MPPCCYTPCQQIPADGCNTQKNTCLLQTVQSRENIYLQKHDGKQSNHVQDKLHLWVLYKYLCMHFQLTTNIKKYIKGVEMCMRSNRKTKRQRKRNCKSRELRVSAFALIYSILCKYMLHKPLQHVLPYITAVGKLNHTKLIIRQQIRHQTA